MNAGWYPHGRLEVEPCPVCGEYSACAFDGEGRPLIHTDTELPDDSFGLWDCSVGDPDHIRLDRRIEDVDAGDLV